jgi:hypothetical protein
MTDNKQQTAVQLIIQALDIECKSRGMNVNWDMYLEMEKKQSIKGKLELSASWAKSREQTAVEWLIEQLLNNENIRWRGTNIIELGEQAKEMEKKRMIEFAQSYAVIHCMGDITKNADEYYEQTYGGGEQ